MKQPRQSGTDCALQRAHRDAIYQMIESIASPVIRHQAIANFPAYLGVQFEHHKVPKTQQKLSWREIEGEFERRKWAFPGIPDSPEESTAPVVVEAKPVEPPVTPPPVVTAPTAAEIDVDKLLDGVQTRAEPTVESQLRQLVEDHADAIWAQSTHHPLFGLKIVKFQGADLVLMHTWLIKGTTSDGRALSYSCSGEVADLMLNKAKSDRVYHDGEDRISAVRSRDGTLDLRVMLDAGVKRQGPLRDPLVDKPCKISDYRDGKTPRVNEMLPDVYYRLTVYPVIYVEGRVVRIWCNESIDDDGYKGNDIWKRRYRLSKGKLELLPSRA